ncbi:putative Phosphatase 2C 55 [Tripterygium wilfordii]|uniref:Protein phosphatase n=1 Tax=Tripterygium wilfordii TaxID=458696 RepID=A0A7J7CEY7_TRIWF|nr:putative Phosphatase 2C 55 [Tripterygium wilfordii]
MIANEDLVVHTTNDYYCSGRRATVNGNFCERKPLKMVSAGSCYLPKDNPSKPRGEDAHFLWLKKNTMGVADGVGGWAKKGIDAGEYARELMRNSLTAVLNEPQGAVDPKRVLNSAFLNTKERGSSTACILTLRDDNHLHCANVGDSGFMVFRDKKLVYKSEAQQRGFNFPFQLGNSEGSDKPSCAKEIKVAVKAGDIVVVGTDGLFDNMYESEIEELLQKGKASSTEDLAILIAEYALYNSFDRFALSPFAKASRKAGFQHKGGKIDDITVLVGIIS